MSSKYFLDNLVEFGLCKIYGKKQVTSLKSSIESNIPSDYVTTALFVVHFITKNYINGSGMNEVPFGLPISIFARDQGCGGGFDDMKNE